MPAAIFRFAFALLWTVYCLIEPATAQVYKWVDEKGVTHYAEHPPQGQMARPVDMTPSPGTSRAKPESSQDWQDENIEFQKRRIQRERQVESEQKKAREKQRRCVLAKDDFRQLESAGRLYGLNEKGERVYLDDAARKVEMENARQSMAANCL